MQRSGGEIQDGPCEHMKWVCGVWSSGQKEGQAGWGSGRRRKGMAQGPGVPLRQREILDLAWGQEWPQMEPGSLGTE